MFSCAREASRWRARRRSGARADRGCRRTWCAADHRQAIGPVQGIGQALGILQRSRGPTLQGMGSLLDALSEQVRAQGLEKRSAVFAVLVPVMLVLFALFLGEEDFETYRVPLVAAAVAGIAVHLVFRWLARRGPRRRPRRGR